MRMSMNVKLDPALADAREKLIAGLRKGTNGAQAAVLVREVGEFEAKQNEQAFATEGKASGQAWPDILQGDGNMKGYRAWKRRNWPNKKLLVWRGDARDSLRHVSGKGRIQRLVGKRLEFGTNNRIVREHMEEQTGKQVVYLREKKPVIRTHKVTGKPTKGRNWFRFSFTRIPARPAVRKSPLQVRHLKTKIAQVLLIFLARETRGRTSQAMRVAAAQLTPSPKAG